MRRTHLTFILCLAAGLFSAVNVQAETVKSLTGVTFASGEAHVEYTVIADTALAVADVVAQTDGSILALRFEQTRTARRWIDSADPIIKRTLLHPSRRDAPAAVIRVRFRQVVPTAVVENIRVRSESGQLVIAIPRDAETARAWSGVLTPAPTKNSTVGSPKKAAAKKSATKKSATKKRATKKRSADVTQLPPVKVTATTPSGSPVKTSAKSPSVAAKNSTVASVDPEADPEAIPFPDFETSAGADLPLETVTDNKDAPVTNALAETGFEGPKFGTVLTALLFIGFIGFIMWRKMRGPRTKDGAGPLIKPIGTHMLGPKQSLLLVDVAGQMVLLGTTDKGVQMLTTIEPSEGAQLAHGAETAVPVDAPSGPAGPSLADRVGGAVAKFRAAAAKVNAEHANARTQRMEVKAERAFFGGRKKAERRVAEEVALDALCDSIVDEAPQLSERRAARRDFAPVTPLDRPLEEPEPPIGQANELLQKLRGLQSA